jgi:hypothetical protein
MMPLDAVPATLQIALLGEVGSPLHGHERIHAVLAWTDRGERYYQSLTAASPPGSGAVVTVAAPSDLPARISSAGHTWRTWVLDSIPAELRHLPPAGAAQQLAIRLAA